MPTDPITPSQILSKSQPLPAAEAPRDKMPICYAMISYMTFCGRPKGHSGACMENDDTQPAAPVQPPATPPPIMTPEQNGKLLTMRHVEDIRKIATPTQTSPYGHGPSLVILDLCDLADALRARLTASEQQVADLEARLVRVTEEREQARRQAESAPWRASYMDMRDQRDKAEAALVTARQPKTCATCRWYGPIDYEQGREYGCRSAKTDVADCKPTFGCILHEAAASAPPRGNE